MPNQARKITTGEELDQKLTSGIEQLYQVALACYGPAAGVALIEPPYGDMLASRDGVTNVQKVHLEDPVENKAARIVVQASKKNNVNVGDGTTAVVILSYHLYRAARKMIAGGYNPMEVAHMLEDAGLKVDSALDGLTEPATEELLQQVASIASGDEAVGALIADTIKEVGAEGGIVIEDFPGTGIFSETIQGFYFNKGFTNINLTNNPSNLESRYTNVPILITDKVLATSSDIASIMDTIVGAGIKDLIIVGDVLEEAQGALMLMRLKAEATVTVVGTPPVLGGKSLFLDDLALVTGGTVFAPGAAGTDFDLEMLGAAETVVVTGMATTIVGREGEEKAIAARLRELNKQLKVSDHPLDRDALKSRIDRLVGKLALIKVGGATEVEQKEVKLRVDDAVRAVQAAARGGVVPGGGVALYHAGGDILTAFAKPFEDLLSNSGAKAAYLLNADEPWTGVDFSTGVGGLTDLKKAGIIDPALVVKETVKNAISVTKILITAKVDISYVDRGSRHE